MMTDQQLEEAYTRRIEEAFTAFAVDVRKRMGRPMTAEQWSLAKLAHCAGYVEGVDEAARLAVEGEGDRR
jgi:hypothetical protein